MKYFFSFPHRFMVIEADTKIYIGEPHLRGPKFDVSGLFELTSDRPFSSDHPEFRINLNSSGVKDREFQGNL